MSRRHLIVDLDGTVADASHRLRLLPDWDAFYSACDGDTPHEDIIMLVNLFHLKGQCTINYLTGRVERVRYKTLAWMMQNNCAPGNLLMRPDGDHRMDSELKLEMAQKAGLTPKNVFFALEDRDQVVRMWRENGYRCLQVNDGDF